MKKTSKLVKAELRKIFLRPTVFILTGLLMLILFVSSYFFQPLSRNMNTTNITGRSVNIVSSTFFGTAGGDMDTRANLNSQLDAMGNILDYYIIANSSLTPYTLLETEINSYKNFYSNFRVWFTDPALDENTAYAQFELLRLRVESLKTSINLLNYNITFYMTQETFDSFLNTANEILNLIPIRTASTLDIPALKNHVMTNIDSKKYGDKFDKLYDEIKPITINSSDFEDIKKQYIDTASPLRQKQQEIASAITDFTSLKTASEKQEDLEVIYSYFSDYKAKTLRAVDAIKARIYLTLADNKSDDELNNYIGFEGYNGYELRALVSINNFLIESDIPETQYLMAFDFNESSGSDYSTWDYMYFAIEIITIFIIIICVYLASYMVSGEQTYGTMKMLVMRPYSRGKILRAKIYATLIFMLFFVVLSAIVAGLIGYFLFGGMSGLSVVMVFNATSVFAVHPIIAMLIYLASVILKIFLFISLAFTISVLFDSNIGAVIISTFAYGLTLLGNFLLGAYSWYKYLPIAHLDLFKYFRVSGTSSIFSAPIYTSLLYAAIYFFTTIIILNVLSFMFFKKKEIN